MSRELLNCYSTCCGALTDSDQMICSDCREHCEIYYNNEEN